METEPFLHKHFLCYDLYKKQEACCYKCSQQIDGRAYSCENCKFWLHKSCAEQELPPQLSHPLHPQHHLSLFCDDSEKFVCDQCFYISGGYRYSCKGCSFNLDLNCASSTKGQLHQEDYGQGSKIRQRKRIHHFSHEHPLDLFNYRKIGKTEIRCSWCEKTLSAGSELLPPRHQFIDMKLDLGKTSGMAVEQEEMEQVETRQSHVEYPALSEPTETNGSIHNGQFKRQIQHFTHHHPLSFLEIIEKHACCDACKMGILGPAYVCESDEYYLHQTCAELFQDVQHPLHSQHPLKLLTTCPTDQGRFICDECGDISKGFVYFCWECEFKLDLKCAAPTTSQNEGQRLKQTKRDSKKSHFSHEHMLVFTNCRPYFKKFQCNGCNLPIVGAAFCCLACSYILHESCLALPKQMKFQFHPEHPLVAKLTQFFEIFNRCHACGTGFRWTNIRYSCSECSLDLHFSCANSLKRPLKHKSHIHNLYYFGTESQKLFENENISFSCNTCSKTCVGPSYRCLECAINFHLECIPIPQRVKSDCHIHPFTLVDSFVEDDLGEYYCDVCEEERHSKDHIYFCEECNGLFVAHIECALAKVEEPAPEIEACSTMEPDLKKTSIQVESKTSLGRETEEMESREEQR
ncbi:hypothetical protein POUND7_000482 [Theobroma cacao]